MRRIRPRILIVGALAAAAQATAQESPGWPQWGRDARHHGMAPVAGQSLDRILADVVYDPFVEQERAEQFGVLTAHFQAPLVDGNDVFMEFKTGTYLSCDPPGWITTEPCAPVADSNGNLYYQAVRLAPSDPWNTDIEGAWLIKVGTDDSASKVSFSSLAIGAPAPTDLCKTQFSEADLPWPPSPTAEPPSVPCGSQRPGINGTAAVGLDGTIYVGSRAHRSDRYSFLLAVNPDLTPKWAASLRDRELPAQSRRNPDLHRRPPRRPRVVHQRGGGGQGRCRLRQQRGRQSLRDRAGGRGKAADLYGAGLGGSVYAAIDRA